MRKNIRLGKIMKKSMALLLALLLMAVCLSACVRQDTSVDDFEYEMRDGRMIITAYKGADKEVQIPQEIEGRTVYKIGESAFEGHNLTSVMIPEGVEYIDHGAFYGCRYLSEVKLPDTLRVIGKAAFGKCESLSKIDLPESVTYLYGASFAQTALVELHLPVQTRLEVDGTILYSPIDGETELVVEGDSEALQMILEHGYGKINYRIANETVETTKEETGILDKVIQKVEEGQEIFEAKSETLYLPIQWVRRNPDGEILSKQTYTYNESGWVTSWEKYWPTTTEEWDDEQAIFVVTEEPCDEVPDIVESYSYDQCGNLTWIETLDEANRYEYRYDDEGRILSYTIIPENKNQKSITIDLQYDEDGTIEQWRSDQSRKEQPLRTMETIGNTSEVISKMRIPNGPYYYVYSFEYDANGNVNGCQIENDSGKKLNQVICNYDEAGRLIYENDVVRGSESHTYQYENSKLVAINDKPLEYVEVDDEEFVVRYNGYEITYKSLNVSKRDADIARYRWDQFCAGFNSYHEEHKGLMGVRYPLYGLNTILLLPGSIY